MVIVGANAIFLLFLKPHMLGDFLKINQKKTHKKSRVRGDWGFERDFFAYFEASYVRWFSQNKIKKKCTKNHVCVVIGGVNAIFLPILKPHSSGNLLKITSTKKRRNNCACVVIGGANAIFLLIWKPHMLGDFLKINLQKNAQKIMSVWWLGVWK